MNSLRFVGVQSAFGYAISDAEFVQNTEQAEGTVAVIDHNAAPITKSVTLKEIDATATGWPNVAGVMTPPQYLRDRGASELACRFSAKVNEFTFGPINVTELGYKNPVVETWVYLSDATAFKSTTGAGFEIGSLTKPDEEEIELQLKASPLVSGWNRIAFSITADRGVNLANLQRIRWYDVGTGVYDLAMTAPRLVDWTIPTISEGLVEVYANRFVPETMEIGVGYKKEADCTYTGAAGISYSSADASIASVAADGKITGVKAGNTTITATDGIVSYDIAVSVVEDSRFVPETLSLFVGDEKQIPNEYQGSGTLTYESGDTEIVTVAADGKLTGKKAGTATVTVTANEQEADKTRSYDIAVTVMAEKTTDTPLFGNDCSLIESYWAKEFPYNAPKGNLGGRSVQIFSHNTGHSENWYNFKSDIDLSAYRNPTLSVWFYLENRETALGPGQMLLGLASDYRRVGEPPNTPIEADVDLCRFDLTSLLPQMVNGWNLLELPLKNAQRIDADFDYSAVTAMGARMISTANGPALCMQLFGATIVPSQANALSVKKTEAMPASNKTVAEQKMYTYASAPSGIVSTGEETNGVYMLLNGQNPSSRVMKVDLDLSSLDGLNLMRAQLNLWLYVSDPAKVMTMTGANSAGIALFNGIDNGNGTVDVPGGRPGMYCWFIESFKTGGNFVKGWNRVRLPLARINEITGDFDFANVNAMTFEQTGGSEAAFIVGDFSITYDATSDIYNDAWKKWQIVASEEVSGEVSVTAPNEIAEFTGTEFTLPAMAVACDMTRLAGLWSSSNDNVIAVDAFSGVMTVKSGGTADITYTVIGGASDTVTLTVQGPALTGIAFTKDSETITGKNSVTLGYTISEVGAAYDSLEFTTSDAAIASVSDRGVVTAKKNGTVTITVTVKAGETQYSDTITVTISGITELTGITLDKTEATIAVDESVTLIASLLGSNLPSSYSVTWLTSDASVASVSHGEVTGIGAGTVTVTARVTIDGVTKEVTATVTVTGGTDDGGKESGGCGSLALGDMLSGFGLMLFVGACILLVARRRRKI